MVLANLLLAGEVQLYVLGIDALVVEQHNGGNGVLYRWELDYPGEVVVLVEVGDAFHGGQALAAEELEEVLLADFLIELRDMNVLRNLVNRVEQLGVVLGEELSLGVPLDFIEQVEIFVLLLYFLIGVDVYAVELLFVGALYAVVEFVDLIELIPGLEVGLLVELQVVGNGLQAQLLVEN